MKKIARLCLILFIILEPWIVTLIHCEILSAKYYDESLLEACNTNGMVEVDTIKILDYKPFSYCKVYGKSTDTGNIFILLYDHENDDTEWEVVHWDTVWSKSGSADGFVWPYIR